MAPRNVHVSSSVSSVSNERQKPSGGMRIVSERQSSKYTSATDVGARRGNSTKRRYAQRVTSASSPKTTRYATGYCSEKSRQTKTNSSLQRNATTRSSASKSPAFVGNLAFPEARNRKMEISRSVTRKCHFPVQGDEFFSPSMKKGPATATEARPHEIVPDSREERIACLLAGAVGALAGLAVPTFMSILKIGGIW